MVSPFLDSLNDPGKDDFHTGLLPYLVNDYGEIRPVGRVTAG
jgi:hypothetical protein